MRTIAERRGVARGAEAIASNSVMPLRQLAPPSRPARARIRRSRRGAHADVVAGGDAPRRPWRSAHRSTTTTVPARSMPPTHGKRRMTLPAPVAASASL